MMVDLNLVLNRVAQNFWLVSSHPNQTYNFYKLKQQINIYFVMVNHAYLNCKKEEEVGDALFK